VTIRFCTPISSTCGASVKIGDHNEKLPVNYESSLLDAWSELERQTESCQDAVNHIIALGPMRFQKLVQIYNRKFWLIT
jgi:hypothetical protein